jgi:hypothetical protein
MHRLRALLIFKLGAWIGFMAAAALAKRAIPSQGDDESDELALVAIFDGIELTSRARAFRGGSMLAWFGGIEADFREAELAPGARLSANTLFGGIALRTPPGWRIESTATSLAGGVDVSGPASDDPDAPVLTLEGRAVFGGIAVKAGAAGAAARS